MFHAGSVSPRKVRVARPVHLVPVVGPGDHLLRGLRLSQLPYLSGADRAAFDGWVEESWARYVPPLSFAEVRKGVQALVRLRETREGEEAPLRRAYEGQGKRAAAATVLSWLRFLAAYHACEMLELPGRGPYQRLWDLGCGCGASGAGLARALGGRLAIQGIDRSGWALGEAGETWSAFGLSGRPRREELPEAFPNAGRAELIVLGWCLGELDARGRRRVAARALSASRRGATLVVLDELAPKPTWWPELADALGPAGALEQPLRVSIERPQRIRAMDKAARQDNQVLAMRALVVGPPARREASP